MDKMQWNSFSDHPPYIGQWIACYRKPWPSFYWMGQYDGRLREDEDMFDHWVEIPEMIKRDKD